MHKFLAYLSIYFCLTCFGLSFSPSSEAGVQTQQTRTTDEFVQLPPKMGLKKARNM
jgi:preprotein translocase subunit SecG